MSNGLELMSSELKEMRRLAVEGASVVEIAAAIGRPAASVRVWAKIHGFTPRRVKPNALSGPRLFCSEGHELSEDNVYISPDRRRRCRICLKAREAVRWQKRKKENHRRRLFEPKHPRPRIADLKRFIQWVADYSRDPIVIEEARKYGARICITANAPAAPIPAPAPEARTAPEPAPGKPPRAVTATPFSVMASQFGQTPKSPPSPPSGSTAFPPPTSEPASASARTP